MPKERLAKAGVWFRRSQLSLIAGAPGGGKSSLITDFVSHMFYGANVGVPTLYFSADGDTLNVGKTALAAAIGVSLSDAERLIELEDTEALDTLDRAIEHIWWCFDSSPSLSDINQELDAYAMVMGEYPHMIIIDNLMDIVDTSGEVNRLEELTSALKSMARFTGAHVCVLAHVTGSRKDGRAYTDGTIPIPRSAIMYKTDRKPELVLTLYQPEPGVVAVCVVKNRSGRAYTDGSFDVRLGWNPERAWWSD